MQTMFTSKMVLLAIGLVVVASAGAVVYKTNHVATRPSTAVKAGMSLKDLLTSAGTVRCTVSNENDKVTSNGIVYVAQGKLRSDFTSIAKEGPLAGKEMLAHMIIDADMSYMWGENSMNMGIKMERKDMMDVVPEDGNTPANNAAKDMNEKSDYHCEDWTLDGSVFNPPTSVTFNDMGDMMQHMKQKGGMTATPTSATIMTAPPQTGLSPLQMQQVCAACDNAGPNKSQCRQSLGCK